MKQTYRVTCEFKHRSVTTDESAPRIGDKIWCRRGYYQHTIVKVEVATGIQREPWKQVVTA